MTRAISSISNFIFEENSIRVDVVGDAPWFVAKDIAAALGIEWRGSATLARIKAAWKGVRKFRTPGGNQELTVINEPAVYKFVFRSNKEEADRFTDWLAGEVLPSIRKTGAYTDKPIHVREHDRRTSTKVEDAVRLKKNIDRLESVVTSIQPTQPNFCAMVIDGEHVFVDINDYKVQPGDRAVVVDHAGAISISAVDPESYGFKPMGPRSALGPRYPTSHGGIARNTVMIVGKVLGGSVRDDRQRVVDDVSAQLRRQITTLLESGPWNDRQIASQLCCNPKLVREVRREQSRKPTDQLPRVGLARRTIEHDPGAVRYGEWIVPLIEKGYSNKMISKMLGCHEETVRRHRVRLVS
ncbi:BRO family protein [Shinella sp.]|uniref:BRO family protein n=1 Tax=Shinella sp. TaxID=1870904 RepID=UPI00289C7DBE|nr:BRO family protein [Shinella sp.]